MSDRNRDDYFDLSNFDDSIDSREYRRRQSVHRQQSNNRNRRSPYNRRRRRNRTRTRNRIMIVGTGILILIFLIFLLSMMFRGCGNKAAETAISTETKEQQQSETVAATTQSEAQSTSAQGGDLLSTSYFMTPEIKDDNSAGIDFGTIYGWNGAGYELFGGSETTAQTYGETVTSLADKLNGVDVFSLVVPNHTEYGLPQRIKDTEVHTNSQADNIKKAYESMGSSVTPINAYNYLAQHNDEYTYFNSDHHWTGLGAYYAYQAFAESNNMTALKLEDCTEQTIEDFTGSFTYLASGLETDTVHYWQLPYSVSMDITYEGGETQSFDSPYFDGESGGSVAYGVFIYGDNPLTVMKSSSENAEPNRKICVIKESYGNAFVPYLTYNYEEVHVVDLRTFRENSSVDLASYCIQNDITDLLFLNGVMSANTQLQLDSISGLFD